MEASADLAPAVAPAGLTPKQVGYDRYFEVGRTAAPPAEALTVAS